jgi:PAS domain S-box-containing protein
MKISASDILEASILVVDDQQDNIDLLRHMLGDAGYTNVTWTLDPEQVCALNRRNHYDLILLDLQMPGMDGFQVIEALKTNDEDDYLPVMVITAQPGHKLRALECGVRDFVSKPFDIVEAKTRIRNMLEVRLLYKRLESHASELEQTVLERTAELRESEARFRSLTELASDWYWEQDQDGHFSKVSGPVLEMLGLQVESLAPGAPDGLPAGWDEAERRTLREAIAARQPFLDFVFSRTRPDGSRQQFRVSGEPMFDRFCNYLGYRGVGVEILANDNAHGLKIS